MRRMRWLGLAKAGPQVRLAAMPHNLCRSEANSDQDRQHPTPARHDTGA
jgi:hypothetical protein